MANVFKPVQAGTEPLASDVDQLRMALSGVGDVGVITLAAQTASPLAPTLAVNGAAGNLNGTYKYQLVQATGWADSDSNTYINGFSPGAEATISVTNGQVNITLPGFAAPVVGTLIYRTAANDASGSEQFVTAIFNSTTTSYVDNVGDGSLGTPSIPATGLLGNPIPAAVPSSNSTGTTLNLLTTILDAVSGHKHTGTAGDAPQVDAKSVAGVVPGTGANNILLLDASGNATIAGNIQGGKVFNATYNDYAEWFRRGDDAEAGDVVVKVVGEDKYVKCSKAHNKSVVGVVSSEGTFAQCIGGQLHENMMDNLDKFIPVGLAGRVPVKVIGTVEEGDELTTSNVPGYAKRAEVYVPGTIIGKALGSNPDGKGMVLMLISNH